MTIERALEWNHFAPEHLPLTVPANMTLRDVWGSVQKQYGRLTLPLRLEFLVAGETADGEDFFGPVPATLWNSRSGSPLLLMRHLPGAGTLDGGGQVIRAEWMPDLDVSGVDLEILGEGTAVRPTTGKARAAPVNIPLHPEAVQAARADLLQVRRFRPVGA